MKTGLLCGFTVCLTLCGILVTTEACNVILIATPDGGNITSPGYPYIHYPDNLRCWWRIHTEAADHTNVVVEVLDISIEQSVGCVYDNLTFYDGWNVSSPSLAVLCGTTKKILISSGSDMFIQFITDSSNEGRGFLLRFYSVEKCGGELIATADAQTFTSPGYPYHYYNNANCTWVIRTESENQTVTLDVKDSQMEQETLCSYDSVTVYNGNTTAENEQLGKFCGNAYPSFQSSQDSMLVHFTTDNSNTYKGFKIQYKAVDVYSCNRTLIIFDILPKYVVSPGYPDAYYDDLECVWTIVSAYWSANSIRIRPLTPEIEGPYPDCTNDSLTVYNGTDTSTSPDELATFCGNATSLVTVHNRVATVIFRTNSELVERGFRLMYYGSNTQVPTTTQAPLSCGTSSLTAAMGAKTLTSPGYPVAYQNNMDCFWHIAAESGTPYMVHVIVDDSDIENNAQCSYDYVKVYDGMSTSSQLLQTWCGSSTPIIQSSGPYMTIHFHSDSSNVYKGFSLRYYQTTAAFTCGGPISVDDDIQYLTSPGYPGNYRNNLDCVWTLTSPTNDQIKIVVLDDSTESSSSCSYDYVKIQDGTSSTSSILSKFCGSQEPTVITSGGSARITFHTDNSNTDRGFRLSYESGSFSPCSGVTELTTYSFSQHFTSPNYPYSYPNNADCYWRLDTELSDYVVTIDVVTSSLEYSSDCQYDYVEAFDGWDETSSSLGKWCGSSMPNKHSSGRYMYIHFHSDNSNTDTGFKIDYSQELKSDFDFVNGGAIAGGVVGGIVFLGILIGVIAGFSRKNPRPIVTQVPAASANSRSNIYTVQQNQYETTVTRSLPASFAPPPSYNQVVRQGAGQGVGAVPPPPYSAAGTTNDRAPILTQST